ncbi:MAG: LysM peptidoglycan-binding domain-containing protein [Deltaproteobacteria bacterium]|nr:LysM peptidoglycan-binding domain-containing protein [Deltaproteobacteria bacterium]
MKSFRNKLYLQIQILLIALFFMLCACVAHAPVNEREEAEEALNIAFKAEAPVYAPGEYTRAKEKFHLAEIEMDKRKYGKAQDLLEESKEDAQIARYKSQAGKAIKLAKEEINKSNLIQLEKYIIEVSYKAKQSLKKAESAFESEKYNLARQKAELSLQLFKELPKLLEEKAPEARKEEKMLREVKKIVEDAEEEAAAIIAKAQKEAAAIRARVLEKRFPSSYKVKRGDTLRIIAGRREIYNDPYQWPIIYKANRDQIRDPHMLFVGQKLVIPRNVTIEEVREARKQAGASSPYDPPPEAFHPSDYK